MVASSWDEALPLFPLPEVVLFPGGFLPLHIFEPRYRQMIHDVLQADSKFGVLMYDPTLGAPVEHGCSAVVANVKNLSDGRMNILTIGQQRFRVLETHNDKPYLMGRVEWIDDDPPVHDLKGKAAEITEILRDVVKLSAKLADKQIDFPDDLPNDPLELSYWVAGSVYGLTQEQQNLLELVDTEARLDRETDILVALRKELAARTALKEAFQ